MIRVLLTPPFCNNTAVRPDAEHLENVLVPGFEKHGIAITHDPSEADWEVAGHRAAEGSEHHRLPKERVVIIDGEVPQPEFLRAYYREKGFAAIICPANKTAYMDVFPYYLPPDDSLRPFTPNGKIAQLSTYRTRRIGWLEGDVNGADPYRYQVLCTLRCEIGLTLKKVRPNLIDIYGAGWPEGTVVEDSRSGAFRGRKLDLLRGYSFDLCWENMEIPNYVSEKLWDPIIAGVLPLYWGPPQIHELLPKDTIIDCRPFASEGSFDVGALLRTVESMSLEEQQDRVRRLQAWHRSLPRDAHRRSLARAVDRLARELTRLEQWRHFNAVG